MPRRYHLCHALPPTDAGRAGLTFAAAAALAHNFVAVIAWIVLAKPGRRRSGALLIGLAGALALAMLVGPHIAGQGAFLDTAAHTVFPGVPHGRALIIGSRCYRPFITRCGSSTSRAGGRPSPPSLRARW